MESIGTCVPNPCTEGTDPRCAYWLLSTPTMNNLYSFGYSIGASADVIVGSSATIIDNSLLEMAKYLILVFVPIIIILIFMIIILGVTGVFHWSVCVVLIIVLLISQVATIVIVGQYISGLSSETFNQVKNEMSTNWENNRSALTEYWGNSYFEQNAC